MKDYYYYLITATIIRYSLICNHEVVVNHHEKLGLGLLGHQKPKEPQTRCTKTRRLFELVSSYLLLFNTKTKIKLKLNYIRLNKTKIEIKLTFHSKHQLPPTPSSSYYLMISGITKVCSSRPRGPTINRYLVGYPTLLPPHLPNQNCTKKMASRHG